MAKRFNFRPRFRRSFGRGFRRGGRRFGFRRQNFGGKIYSGTMRKRFGLPTWLWLIGLVAVFMFTPAKGIFKTLFHKK